MSRIRAIVREAFWSAFSQPVASVLTVLMVAAMVLTVMLTTGRTVGAEQRVLGSIDSTGTRSIVIRAQAGAGITSDVVARIKKLEGVQWVAGFSAAIDATNVRIVDGTRVPARYAYGTDLEKLGVRAESPIPESVAYASAIALTQLGMPDTAGGIALTDSTSYAIAGQIDTPDFLKQFEPLVIVPRKHMSGSEPVNLLVVIASSPKLIGPVSSTVISLLSASDPTKVTVQTSEALAQLRALIQGQLGTFSRALVLALLAVMGTLVAVILYGLVMLRRKDFGRRRALGASRALIVVLLITQTAILGLVGVAAGTLSGLIAAIVQGDPLPGIAFTVALAILALTTTLVAALIPAFVASRRDPVAELRIP